MSTNFEVKVTHQITREQVGNLLSSAFEGGSNYWYRIEEFHKPSVYQFNYGADLGKEAGYFKQIDYPLNPDGYLVVSDYHGADDGEVKKRTLSSHSIKRGLRLMSESKDYAHHWRDLLAEDDDQTTADVFLQFCLFGDVVYG